ncbi:MAG: diguanylate cyclase [Gammaproteobacteria bacterium]|nr:diguanylate cyclase [Gammaproteobacteria bacterium]MDP2348196.1 diguanylate cyclase [Gammaproteobacteria bacterium]
MNHTTEHQLPEWSHLCSLVGLAADWVWEQDSAFRFTRFHGRNIEGDPGADATLFRGKSRWDIGLKLAGESADWPSHQALLDAGKSFSNVIMERTLADGSRRYVSVSGAPFNDANGKVLGYRGVGQDVTQSQQAMAELRWFRASIDASHDCIIITDVESQRFLYVNQTLLDLTGYTREEYMKLQPHQSTSQTPEEIARIYAEVIAAGDSGLTAEAQIYADKSGTRKAWWEFHRRAVQVDGRWLLSTISSDVTRRILAEQAAQRAARMYATLNASNESIVRARSSAELFQQICRAAIDFGGFVSASILLVEPGSSHAKMTAIAGLGKQVLRDLSVPIDYSETDGTGLVGAAYNTGKPSISNDFLNDPRTVLWHSMAAGADIKAAAAIPIIRDHRPIGVLMLCAREKRAFDDETLQLLERITQNLTIALHTIEREAERERAEERIRYMATHDSLTGLPNRMLFSELLNSEIRSAQRHKRHFAVMFIDLDRFKQINDTLGHAAGDQLLKVMANRMRDTLRASDVVARISGDEFVAMLTAVNQPEDAHTVAGKLLATLSKPVSIGDEECSVSASIGISLFPLDGDDEQLLMNHADAAMYAAKEKGKNAFQFYSKDI